MRKRAKCGCSSCQGQGLSVFVSTPAEEGIIKESLGYRCALFGPLLIEDGSGGILGLMSLLFSLYSFAD